MQIRTRFSISADGYVTTPDGWPALVGGPRTIETVRALGALDKLGLIVLPILLGGGMRLTPALSTDTKLTLESERPLARGSAEIT